MTFTVADQKVVVASIKDGHINWEHGELETFGITKQLVDDHVASL